MSGYAVIALKTALQCKQHATANYNVASSYVGTVEAIWGKHPHPQVAQCKALQLAR